MRCMIALALMSVASFVFYPTPAHADAIVLASASGGIYDYNISITTPGGLTFQQGQAISFTGLSGVISASVLPGTILSQCFTATSLPTSATFVDTNCPVITLSGSGPGTVGTLEIVSTSLSVGPVSYSWTLPPFPTVSGTVNGPVVPEPSTILLLGTGLVGLMGKTFRRKRNA